MTNWRDLIIAVKANTGDFKRGMAETRGIASKTVGSIKTMGSQVKAAATSFAGLAAGVLSVGAAVSAMRDWTAAANEQEEAEMSLAAALKATAGAAKLSLAELKEYAAARQAVTTYGDEATLKMMSVLATFSNVQGDVFRQGVDLAQDLSAAFGQDLKASAIQVGKALNDPLTGLTALRRVGVSFTDDQKAMIKSFMEVNDVAGAQAVILEGLKQNVGGFAEAMAQTSSGQMAQFKNALGDVKELLGAELIPYLNAAANSMRGMATDAESTTSVVGTFRSMLAFAADTAQVFWHGILTIRGVLLELGSTYAWLVDIQAKFLEGLTGWDLSAVRDYAQSAKESFGSAADEQWAALMDDYQTSWSDLAKRNREEAKKAAEEVAGMQANLKAGAGAAAKLGLPPRPVFDPAASPDERLRMFNRIQDWDKAADEAQKKLDTERNAKLTEHGKDLSRLADDMAAIRISGERRSAQQLIVIGTI